MKEYANIKARITTDMKRQQKFCKMNSGKVMKYRNKHCCLSALHQSNDQIFWNSIPQSTVLHLDGRYRRVIRLSAEECFDFRPLNASRSIAMHVCVILARVSVYLFWISDLENVLSILTPSGCPFFWERAVASSPRCLRLRIRLHGKLRQNCLMFPGEKRVVVVAYLYCAD